jgi:hypothetical protein
MKKILLALLLLTVISCKKDDKSSTITVSFTASENMPITDSRITVNGQTITGNFPLSTHTNSANTVIYTMTGTLPAHSGDVIYIYVSGGHYNQITLTAQGTSQVLKFDTTDKAYFTFNVN